jgi:UDPglucose 6-dehydrogenase
LPKELHTLANAGNAVGLPMLVTDAASAANLSHQHRFARRVLESLEGIDRPTVAILGLAFKANTDDVRSSPALNLIHDLNVAGVRVVAYDPAANENARREIEGLTVGESAEIACSEAHVVVIATEWQQFRSLDWQGIRKAMARPVIYDGRRLLDGEAMRDFGFTYETVGRGRT